MCPELQHMLDCAYSSAAVLENLDVIMDLIPLGPELQSTAIATHDLSALHVTSLLFTWQEFHVCISPSLALGRIC